MMDTSEFGNFSKEEIIERYDELLNDYDEVTTKNDELYAENIELKEELKTMENGQKDWKNWLNKKLNDIKFGTDLQRDLLTIVFGFAEEYGIEFKVLDGRILAKNVSAYFGNKLEMSNKIADLLVAYFEY